MEQEKKLVEFAKEQIEKPYKYEAKPEEAPVFLIAQVLFNMSISRFPLIYPEHLLSRLVAGLKLILKTKN